MESMQRSELDLAYTLTRLMWKATGKLDQHRLKRQQVPQGVQVYKNIRYRDDDLPAHVLDVYVPHGTQGLLPTIVNVHGGGWVYGNKELYQNYGMALSKQGFAVVNIDYRLAPANPHPAQVQDVLWALSWLRVHGSEYHADPDNVSLCGDSAGAYISALAACLCTTPHLADFYQVKPANTHFNANGVCCGVFDMETVFTCRFPRKKDHIRMVFGRRDYKASPYYAYSSVLANMTEQFPPCYILGTQCDGLCGESVRMAQRCAQLGIVHHARIWSKRHKKLSHVFHLNPAFEESLISMKEMCAFFRHPQSDPVLLAPPKP